MFAHYSTCHSDSFLKKENILIAIVWHLSSEAAIAPQKIRSGDPLQVKKLYADAILFDC